MRLPEYATFIVSYGPGYRWGPDAKYIRPAVTGSDAIHRFIAALESEAWNIPHDRVYGIEAQNTPDAYDVCVVILRGDELFKPIPPERFIWQDYRRRIRHERWSIGLAYQLGGVPDVLGEMSLRNWLWCAFAQAGYVFMVLALSMASLPLPVYAALVLVGFFTSAGVVVSEVKMVNEEMQR